MALLNHSKELAKQSGCKAITLDSGLPRTGSHGFYEHYGFEKSSYGFEMMI
ncbi:GNAT family N-acetyltransferase [Coprococcus eutactus]|uniref:GNAT family N-acetyltransferase n=1 Tax=Coprococcus eutactus TaxID=33043 RepID=UPI00210C31AF|nr:GNAT family N-acetyltransferase [Coprococcus eutactus]MCQ5134362.1 GNAT family N-acetyltransferase [Coprococcus eutactus]